MNDSNRFPDSAFDRIAAYLPAEQRASYYRYVAHLRTLNPKDELLILAEGMAVFTCISRQLPEAVAEERAKLLADFAKLCTKHESSTANATTDVRAMFGAHLSFLQAGVDYLDETQVREGGRGKQGASGTGCDLGGHREDGGSGDG